MAIPSLSRKRMALGVLALLCLLPALRFVAPSEPDPLMRPVGVAGFSHIYASQAAIDALAELDAQLEPGNNLIGVPWPQMALDVRHSRVFNMRTALLGAEFYRHKLFFGRVHNLVVVLPRHTEERGGTQMVVGAFREHGDWRRIRPEVEDFVFMYSGPSDDLH
jgi:hypothetical protein